MTTTFLIRNWALVRLEQTPEGEPRERACPQDHLHAIAEYLADLDGAGFQAADLVRTLGIGPESAEVALDFLLSRGVLGRDPDGGYRVRVPDPQGEVIGAFWDLDDGDPES